jgi:hypothetical protein
MIILFVNYYSTYIFSPIHSIITKINFIPAYNCIPSVLLQCWTCPSCEFTCLPVIEVLLAVVVRIPNRIWSEWSTCVSASEYLVPHICTCVNTDSSSPSLNCSNQFFDILAVRLWSTYGPWTTWTRVSFNIKPDSSSCIFESWSWG